MVEISFREEILSLLASPITWVLIEILSVLLFVTCVIDAYRSNEEKVRLYRVLELFGYVFYSGVFENIGVLIGVYDYSLDRLIMFGVVPLQILLLEGSIFYVAMRFTEKRQAPKWATPFIVGLLCVLQDLTIDPVAVYDLHMVNGKFEGQWNWTLHYANNLFGIPYYNFTGWFIMMFYYSTVLLVGRHYFEKSDFKPRTGIIYIILAPLVSILLIVSPLTNFLLFAQPFAQMFNRTAEIVMASIVMGISGIIMLVVWKPKQKVHWKDDRLIWVLPLVLHMVDIMYAFILQIQIAYIPVFLFGAIHMLYLCFYLKLHPKMDEFITKISKKVKGSSDEPLKEPLKESPKNSFKESQKDSDQEFRKSSNVEEKWGAFPSKKHN